MFITALGDESEEAQPEPSGPIITDDDIREAKESLSVRAGQVRAMDAAIAIALSKAINRGEAVDERGMKLVEEFQALEEANQEPDDIANLVSAIFGAEELIAAKAAEDPLIAAWEEEGNG